ncbi:hypothetical protein [Parapedobacter defluvii]
MNLWTLTKNLVLAVSAAFLVSSCTFDKQAKALRALEKCRYEYVSADSVFLAGTDVNKLIANGRVDVSQLPGIAMGFLSRDIPLSGVLNVRITNPTSNLAGIQQFAYKVEVEKREILDGISDLPIEVPPGETVTVPIRLRTNVYKFLSDRETLNKLVTFIQSARNGVTDEKVNLTFKIKPTLALGNKAINYPGYIDINKEVDAEFLVKQGIFR